MVVEPIGTITGFGGWLVTNLVNLAVMGWLVHTCWPDYPCRLVYQPFPARARPRLYKVFTKKKIGLFQLAMAGGACAAAWRARIFRRSLCLSSCQRYACVVRPMAPLADCGMSCL